MRFVRLAAEFGGIRIRYPEAHMIVGPYHINEYWLWTVAKGCVFFCVNLIHQDNQH